jgi:hypothetical protein
MYHCILTGFEDSDLVGLKIRRQSGVIIKDTLVIQTPSISLFGYICRSNYDQTFGDESIQDGPDVLLNIDRGRISTEEELSIGSGMLGYHGADGSNPGEQNELGRYPNNVVFVHDDECEYQGTTKIEGITGGSVGQKNNEIYGDYNPAYVDPNSDPSYVDEDGQEEIDNWNCTPNCRVQDLDHQSGERPGCTSPSDAAPSSKYHPGQHGDMTQGDIYGDTGGASRFHFQARSAKRALEHIESFIGPIHFVTPH